MRSIREGQEGEEVPVVVLGWISAFRDANPCLDLWTTGIMSVYDLQCYIVLCYRAW